VTAVCRTRNVDQARELGADRVVDYTQEDFTALGDRYDVIVDVAGGRPWGQLRRALAPDGRVVVVGAPGGNRLVGPLSHIVPTMVAAKARRGNASFFIAKFSLEDMEVLRELLESGKVKPAIERVYPFDELVDALEAMGEGHARANLVVTL
jgi:NADPH:quinone reductase-like Zn-dependent oxidoreductase